MSTTHHSVRIARTLDDIPDAEWQRLVEGRPALRLELLRAIAEHASRPLSLQAFLLEDQQGLAAAGLCEFIGADSAHNSLDSLLLGRAAPAVHKLGVSTQPVFLFQTPFMRQSPVLARTADSVTQREWFECLVDGIEAHAAALRAGVAFLGLTSADEALATVLRARHYLHSALDTTAELDVAWSDFDSYVVALRRHSKKAAQNARTERNRSRRNGIVIRQIESTEPNARRLHRLTREHFRHRNRVEPLYGPDFMPQLAWTLRSDLLIFEAARAEECLAMLAVVRSGPVGMVTWIGIEQHRRRNDFTYANLSFYHPADWAPALGLRTLIYGRAAQDAKAKRGCRLLLCHLFYRPSSSMARWLAAPLLAVHQLRNTRRGDAPPADPPGEPRAC
jgi:predicted N-acyltransferase